MLWIQANWREKHGWSTRYIHLLWIQITDHKYLQYCTICKFQKTGLTALLALFKIKNKKNREIKTRKNRTFGEMQHIQQSIHNPRTCNVLHVSTKVTIVFALIASRPHVDVRLSSFRQKLSANTIFCIYIRILSYILKQTMVSTRVWTPH